MLAHLRKGWPLLFGILVFVFGVFVAEKFGWYDHVAHIDKLFHVLGGIAVAWMAMALLQKNVVRESWWAQIIVVTGVAALVGVLWEVAEYGGTLARTAHPLLYHYYHSGGLADTLGDLIADIAGGILFAFWALWRERS